MENTTTVASLKPSDQQNYYKSLPYIFPFKKFHRSYTMQEQMWVARSEAQLATLIPEM